MRPRFALFAVLALASCAGAGPLPPHATSPAAPPPEASERSEGPEARETEPESPTADALPTSDGDEGSSEEEMDDGLEMAGESEDPAAPAPPEAASLSVAEVEKKLREDPASLGALSIGYASGGMLWSGVRMPQGEHYDLIDPAGAWGTEETIAAIVRCLAVVNSRFPDTPKMFIGHISGKHGGPLSPHKSHQSGRDVDLGYYYEQGESRWFARATAKNLDRKRTWAFVRALITETDVELILIDTSIQKLLKEYARDIGEDPTWLDQVFQVGSKARRPLVRYAPGHATHLHVRFYNPRAQELGRLAHGFLVEQGRIKAPLYYATHKAKKGETLGSIANRYGTTVKAIQEANGLRGTLIKARATYKIPKTGAVKEAARIKVPPRLLPPTDPPEPPEADPGSAQ